MVEDFYNRLKKKLEKSPALLKDHTTFVEELAAKGYAQRVPQYQKESNFVGKTWFIPHHGVYHPHKPGKIRVVFDCSAKYKGKSLNDLLLRDQTSQILFWGSSPDFGKSMWRSWWTSRRCSTRYRFQKLTAPFSAFCGGRMAICPVH